MESVSMDPFIPDELNQCTTIKIEESGEVLDYTDEDSPGYREPFLRVIEDGENIRLLDMSDHVVATFIDSSTIQGTLATGGMQELSLDVSTLQCPLGTFDVTCARRTLCCGGGGISYDISLQDSKVVQFVENFRTRSTQVDFFGDDPKEKLFAVLLVVSRMFFE